jgi:hypothetical protein
VLGRGILRSTQRLATPSLVDPREAGPPIRGAFEVQNYTHTGADSPRADKNLPIDAPTVIFTSKVPNHNDNDLSSATNSSVLRPAE